MKPHLYPNFSLAHRLNLVGWLRIGLLLGHTALARIVTRTNSGGALPPGEAIGLAKSIDKGSMKSINGQADCRAVLMGRIRAVCLGP